jgi:hypothetical protein
VQDTTIVLVMMSGGVVGGLIGGIIGLRQNKKVINELDEMIRYIKEMSDLDEENDKAKSETEF